jgi:hypothetical protein
MISFGGSATRPAAAWAFHTGARIGCHRGHLGWRKRWRPRAATHSAPDAVRRFTHEREGSRRSSRSGANSKTKRRCSSSPRPEPPTTRRGLRSVERSSPGREGRGDAPRGESVAVAQCDHAAERAERSIAARLSLLPALVGLFVGVLYTVGAVLTTGQLRRANLVVRDTLPLVPLAQLLGRGMSVFLKPFAGVLGIALVFVAALIFGDAIERALDLRTTNWTSRKHRVGRLAAVIVGVLALALLSPPDVAVGVAVCATVLLLWVVGLTPLRKTLLTFAALAAVMLLGLSFYRPEPLAHVTVHTPTGRMIRGDLITSTSGTWYLGQAHRNFVAVLPSEITSIRVDSGPHSSAPVFRRLLNSLTH